MNSAEKACDTTLDDETNGNIIECCNNTHKGRYIASNKRALWTLVTAVTLVVC